MKKKIFTAAAIAVFCLVFCFALAGCDWIDRSVLPEGYVEVTDLKVQSANVYLSPNGDTASYQLEVEVLPANANQALTYYVPSQYLKYITVSKGGLITAREVTPEGLIIPLKVTSTTNKDKYLTISVVVQEAEVDRVSFSPSSLTLDYRGDPVLLNPVFEPYHAQDGRSLNYTSGNTSVCTVDERGQVTPVGAGHAYIYVTSQTLSGRLIESWVEVTVHYTPGDKQYRLDVSDSAPAYNQVLGDFKAIKFNLVRLNEHLNPNVDIYWFVDRERVPELNGQWQYEHIPTVNTKTSYKVRVRICANDEPDIELESHEITIYNPFAGYDLTFGNSSSVRDSYRYGTVQTFSLTAGQGAVKRYDWYLRKLGEGGEGELVRSTSASGRDLVVRLNIEGDFVLTAVGRDDKGEKISEKEFEFSVTRLMEGDTLIVNPALKEDGLPPESYDFYLTEYDKNGNRISNPRYIGAAGEGESFLYPLNVSGHYVISSRAISDGVVAKVDGKEYYVETEVLHVGDADSPDPAVGVDIVSLDSRYAVRDYAYVQAPTIGGVYSDGEKILVRWDPTRGVPGYVVEIKKEDGSVFLLDSDGEYKSAFGSRYVIVPSSVVGPTDRFSLRIKGKGGLFSERYYYGYTAAEGRESYYFAEIPTELYGYLKPISGVITGYLTTPEELGELIAYLVLNRPTTNDVVTYENRRINNADYRSYTVRIYTAFDLAAVAEEYPEVEEGTIAEEFETVYRVTAGVQTAYAPTGYLYRYAYSVLPDGGYSFTVMVPDRDTAVIRSKEMEKTTTLSPDYSLTPYGAGNSTFVVNTRKKVRVTDSEQLYYALAGGNAVTLGTDAMVNLYAKIVATVNSLVDASMTDGEKALAFYDYLTANVVYDEELVKTDVGLDAYRYAGFRLEGVFHYGQAVCDGVSKAYVALCAIEGIPCVRVVGEINGAEHAWNKVFLDGEWYVVDATNGSLNDDGVLVSNHAFFGLTEAGYRDLLSNVVEIGDYPVATGDYGYYDTHSVSSQEELNALINAFPRVKGTTALDIRFDADFADGTEAIKAAVDAIDNLSPNDISETIVYLTDNRAILLLI
ncbi:MAG: hypothetical protein IJ735_07065 [Clostridia bacterium]|nr:hypothetical protein [Clostridia bacterium]